MTEWGFFLLVAITDSLAYFKLELHYGKLIKVFSQVNELDLVQVFYASLIVCFEIVYLGASRLE